MYYNTYFIRVYMFLKGFAYGTRRSLAGARDDIHNQDFRRRNGDSHKFTDNDENSVCESPFLPQNQYNNVSSRSEARDLLIYWLKVFPGKTTF